MLKKIPPMKAKRYVFQNRASFFYLDINSIFKRNESAAWYWGIRLISKSVFDLVPIEREQREYSNEVKRRPRVLKFSKIIKSTYLEKSNSTSKTQYRSLGPIHKAKKLILIWKESKLSNKQDCWWQHHQTNVSIFD